MSRLRRSLARSDERGFTALEVVITVAILAVAVFALLNTLDNATKAHSFTVERNEALDDLRLMADVFAKDVRQGIEATTVLPTEFTFDTYIDAAQHEVTWRTRTVSGSDRLERVVDGTTTSVYIVDLTTQEVFSYFDESVPANVSRVRIALATQPDPRFAPVGIETEVEMRNVG